MNVKKWIAMLLALFCLTTTALAEEIIVPVVGGEAPDFEVQTIDGETFKLSRQHGKVVLINIWATWCGPCVSEMPELDRLAQDYEDQLVVIGINCGESEQKVANFVEETGYGYLFAADPEFRISGLLYPTEVIPYTIVVDPYGIITVLHHGSGANIYEVLEGYVQQALKAKNPSGVEILA